MKIAISTDAGFVSPHFGRCPTFTLAEIESGEILNIEEISNPGHHPGYLPDFLSERGVSCIICGSMGNRAQGLFAQKGIDAFWGVDGRVDQVIQKYAKGELERGLSSCQPGSGKGYGIEKTESIIPIQGEEGGIMPRGDGTGPGGQGPGSGRGMGRGGGRGRMGGQGLGLGGDCVCPSCGTRVAHQRGVPCYQVSCPKCGAKMTR